MSNPYSISCRLYLDRHLLNAQLRQAQGSFAYKELVDQGVFVISEPTFATIEAQYYAHSDAILALITAILASGYQGKCVFSLCIRAYEYVPEINFPADMVQAISSIKAAIDVDLVDMIERNGSG